MFFRTLFKSYFLSNVINSFNFWRIATSIFFFVQFSSSWKHMVGCYQSNEKGPQDDDEYV
ncbi:hypothetical protein X975_21598, partial [Stegodyphus mimosarum]